MNLGWDAQVRQAPQELPRYHGPTFPRWLLESCLYVVIPDGPYTAHLRAPAPKMLPGIVFGTRVFQWAVYGPFRNESNVG